MIKLNNVEIGKIGENLAVNFLLDKGYEILGRNFKIWGGEIDIIAKKDESIVFVEVKTRTSESFTPIEDTLTESKISFIENAAEEWFFRENHQEIFWQIDFIGIILRSNLVPLKIEHIEDIQI